MTTKKIEEVRKELIRFEKRLCDYENQLYEGKYSLCGTKQSGALKRSAMDLKMILTENITKR